MKFRRIIKLDDVKRGTITDQTAIWDGNKLIGMRPIVRTNQPARKTLSLSQLREILLNGADWETYCTDDVVTLTD